MQFPCFRAQFLSNIYAKNHRNQNGTMLAQYGGYIIRNPLRDTVY